MQFNILKMSIDFIFKTSEKRKYPAVRINKDGELEFLAPSGFPLAMAEKLLKKNPDILTKLRIKYECHVKRKSKFEDGRLVYWYGTGKKIRFSRRSHAVLETELIIPAGDEKSAVKGVEKLYRAEAEHFLPQRTFELAKLYDIRIKKVSIGGASSRWGSCSRDGRIRFSWRLIQCRKELIDYVIIHELTHRICFDHSKNFYAEAEKMLNGFKRLKDELRIFSKNPDIL